MVFPFEFPGLKRWEGARARLLSLSQGLQGRGVEVHILSKLDTDFTNQRFNGIPLHHFHVRNNIDSKISKFLNPARIGMDVQQLDSNFHYDIIHLHLPIVAATTMIWRPLIRAKTIFDTHDWYKLNDELYYNLPLLPTFLSSEVDAIERLVSKFQDGVIVATPLLSKLSLNPSGTYVVPNAVDTNHFKPLESKFRGKTFEPNCFVVGFLGVVSIYQGVWKLLEATKIASSEVDGLRLLVVGTGDVEGARSYAAKLGISKNVFFTGPNPVPYSEVPDLINAMDVAISPLQREPKYQEYAQPIKMLEYMACDVPVIATPLKEQSRLIKEAKHGLVAKGFEARDLADAIITVSRNREALTNKKSSRSYILGNFASDAVIDALISTYHSVLNQS
jgi:glycosyltransferase involved in cell wall biosynthesis